MDTVQATITWSEGKYFVYTDSEIGISTMGRTIAEAKEAFQNFLEEYKEECIEDNAEVPKELQGNYTTTYTLDTSALLQQVPITLKALADASGINQRQLSAYKNGIKSPRKETQAKIINGIRSIGDTLSKVTL